MLLTTGLVLGLYIYIVPQNANLNALKIRLLQMLAAVFPDRIEVVLPFWLQNRRPPYEP